ncbi:hypothetical protein DOT_2634 [Desulfosporosinus sp. OT]|nr:hypothetical protein DOT_2634 [Desulfosporosinus sp. OT]
MYDARLKHWNRKTVKAFAEGDREREEVLWINSVAARTMTETLFNF